MKLIRIRAISVIIALLLLGSRHSLGQDFVNLNFASATIVPVAGATYGRVEFAAAFPGWTGYTGTNIATLALYDNIFLDSSGIGIIDPIPSIPIDVTAVLQAGFGLDTFQSENTILSQTGVVPDGTQSLIFDADYEGSANSFAVALNGQMLPLIPLSTDASGYTEYGASIGSWADQTATLSFTVLAQVPHLDDNTLYLKDIQFSTSPVPEPGSIALLCMLVGLSLAWRGQNNVRA